MKRRWQGERPTPKELNRMMVEFCRLEVQEKNGVYLYYEDRMPYPEVWEPSKDNAPSWQRFTVLECVMENGLLEEFLDVCLAQHHKTWEELKDKSDFAFALTLILDDSNEEICLNAALAAKMLKGQKREKAKSLLRLV